jgi:hypothetical protein
MKVIIVLWEPNCEHKVATLGSMQEVKCPICETLWTGQEKNEVLSCPDAIAKVLKEWKEEENETTYCYWILTI